MDSGFILINKPIGLTSFGVVRSLRKITGIRKIGHAGTLDPLADGLLLCAIGRESTKKIGKLIEMDKVYLVSLVLGETSNTFDTEGEIVKKDLLGLKIPSIEDIKKECLNMTGSQKQIPPIFSAKKISGKKYYELARKGIDFVPKEQDIIIDEIKLIKYDWPSVVLEIHCSKGTYIRSFVNDFGKNIRTGAVMYGLTRLSIGGLSLKDAVLLEDLTENNWLEKIYKKNIKNILT